jgi:hypothetical protein
VAVGIDLAFGERGGALPALLPAGHEVDPVVLPSLDLFFASTQASDLGLAPAPALPPAGTATQRRDGFFLVPPAGGLGSAFSVPGTVTVGTTPVAGNLARGGVGGPGGNGGDGQGGGLFNSGSVSLIVSFRRACMSHPG